MFPTLTDDEVDLGSVSRIAHIARPVHLTGCSAASTVDFSSLGGKIRALLTVVLHSGDEVVVWLKFMTSWGWRRR